MTISQHNANQTITELSFRSGTDRLTLAVVRSSYSIDDLLDMAMQRHVVAQYPFVYEYPASTALNQLTFYEHDHLGNLRVAFTPVVDCNSPTGTEPDPLLNHPNSSFTLEQVVDYYPYGKILRQYINANGPERYMTTQHERDQETELDYRGARYYDSDVARFLSLDPAQAEYPSWSPYNYVMGNPISLIDPTGRNADKYTVDGNGYVQLVQKTEDCFDELTYQDASGDAMFDPLIVHDQSILPQLAGASRQAMTSGGRPEQMHLASGTNKEAMTTVFKFLADHTSVEWGFMGFKTGGAESLALGTSHSSGHVASLDQFFNKFDKTFDLHSHQGPPGEKSQDIHFGFGGWGDVNRAAGEAQQLSQRGLPFPPHGVYHVPSQNLYSYSFNTRNQFVGHIRNACDLLKRLP